MKVLLAIAGVLALIASGNPDLVMLGFFLIVPGLILVAAPTVFPYLLSTAVLPDVTPAEPSASFRHGLARMGMGVEDLPFPPNLTPERLAQRKERVRRALEK